MDDIYTDDADVFRHVYREPNAEADRLAGLRVSGWHVEPYDKPFQLLRLQFDGSSTSTHAGCGWALYGAEEVNHDVDDKWTLAAWHAFRLPAKMSCTAAELEAMAAGVHFIAADVQGYEVSRRCLQTWQPWDFSKSIELMLYESMQGAE